MILTMLDGLIEALAASTSGDIIFLPGMTKIDCTARVLVDELVLELPGGVTVASDRGRDGSAGALLFSDTLATRPLIRVTGPDAGPDAGPTWVAESSTRAPRTGRGRPRASGSAVHPRRKAFTPVDCA